MDNGNGTDAHMSYPESSAILSNVLIPAQTSAITDAQIDPALLEAVVTALQHANQNQAPPEEPAPPAGPGMVLNSESYIRPQRRGASGKHSQEGGMVHVIPPPKVKRRRRSSTGDAQMTDGMWEGREVSQFRSHIKHRWFTLV